MSTTRALRLVALAFLLTRPAWGDEASPKSTQLLPELTLVGGLDIQSGTYDVSWRLPALDFSDGDDAGPLFGRPVSEIAGDGTFFRPSAYALAEVSPLAGLKLLPGVRADYTRDTDAWTVDPRIAFRYDLYPSERRTTVKGGARRFRAACSSARSNRLKLAVMVRTT